jgi:PAS domain S-box-containing protein
VDNSSRVGTSRMGDGLEILSEDGEYIFGRVWREVAGDRRKVLILFPASDQPAPTTLDRLTHEYSLKDQLDSSWAAKPIELVREHGRTILAFVDSGGELLSARTDVPMEMGRFLLIAIGLAAALHKVHQQGLIHKDINPSHILVDDSTNRVWLTGFGVASRLPRERQSPSPPEFIAGTLSYMAPEQTGRMNRSIDSRSDLYSLGITLYQMLTGALPFNTRDTMELVHCHIARTALPPNQRLETIPGLVAQLVMKLLAKTAEERYQTAAGVEHDLRRCHTEWERRGHIEEFPLAQRDVAARLMIPEKLYGRSREVATLLESFNRVVTTGIPEFVLISGYSGVGKSSVVNELHKALVPPRGLFAAGKLDPHKRDIPYATVAQAFRSLVRQILSKSATEVEAWREAFREALGPNGLLMLDLIPELKLVIGEQPPVADLSPRNAQRRFQTVLRQFIGVFARPEHPLALFLDDLQWLDAATLDLLEDLLTQSDIKHLLLIGAYRENEVDVAHPLSRKLETIRRTGATVHDIVLAPLTYEDLTQLISHSIRCETKPPNPLVQVVHEKTGGNPFFAIQFLHALVDEMLLVFDHGDARWFCDLGRIHGKRYTDNVVDLMIVKLNRLPVETQSVLRQLACIGSDAEFALLAITCQITQDELHQSLWEAIRSGLVHCSENSYAFQHDRIREAAYSLVPEDIRTEAHLRLGRLLLEHTLPDKREEMIFEIVNQFNRGSEHIVSQDERFQLAELNLIAGKRAKLSSAYASALIYLNVGAELLLQDGWHRRHELFFALELNRAECEFLTGQPALADRRLMTLSDRAATAVERAAVTCLHIDVCTTLDQSGRAVDVGLNYLRHIGIEWSANPKREEVQREYARIWSLLQGRTIEDLLELPRLEDATSLATVEVLTKVLPPAWFTDHNVACLIICKAVCLSLERGNCDASCVAYVWLARIAISHFSQHEDGLRFGQLSYNLVERQGLKRFEASVCLVLANLMHWMRPLRVSRDLLRRAFEAANRIGDLTYGVYASGIENANFLFAGEPLQTVEDQIERSRAYSENAKFGALVEITVSRLAHVRMLRGATPRFGSLDDAQFNELRIEKYLSSTPGLTTAACWYWIRKLQARWIAGDYSAAIDALSRAQPLLWTSSGHLEEVEYHFYGALSLAACCDTAPSGERCRYLDAIAGHHRQLQAWTEHCPENFSNRTALVAAEIARIEGLDLDAMRLYERAISSAREHGFVQIEGVAYEVASHFYSSRGFADITETYLRKARNCYFHWGADGKVRQLDQLYPHLATRERLRSTAITGPEIQQLDVVTVVKASQALSSEIVLPKLIERLMTIAIENAGADRAVLILPSAGEYLIRAEARASGDRVEVTTRDEPITGATCPESLIRYVIRTQESVILDDATKPNLFSDNHYVGDRQLKSILCLPLIKLGKLIGILLLENALASHAFTTERIAVLELLAAQAAISLENTRLYGDLQEREAKVRRLVDSNIIGIAIIEFDGRVMDANDAILRIVGYNRDDLAAGLRWNDLTPAEWNIADERALADIAATGACRPYEKEFFRKDGSRAPVLVAGASFDEVRHQGVVFALDLTERKRTEAALREAELRNVDAQMQLAHANRIATMGQLAASLAHEINQPVGAALINAGTAARWLARQPPNIEEVRRSNDRIVSDVSRVADIIARIRDFSKKTVQQKDDLEINDAILEIMTLARAAMPGRSVSAKMQLSEGLPYISGDRVQLQQVILNLIMNAIEAMGDVTERARELLIKTTRIEPGSVLIAISDSGPGLPQGSPERLFEAFYTTKASGLGMGLAICRSIVEAHGGKLWATPNEPHGAVFCVTLPVREETSAVP